jgi:hypothetical protein
LFHQSTIILAIALPVALIAKDTALVAPIDYILGVLLPLHGHYGLNSCVSDYVPKSPQPLARVGVFIITGASIYGITKLNMEGPGLTNTVLALWQPRVNKNSDKH